MSDPQGESSPAAPHQADAQAPGVTPIIGIGASAGGLAAIESFFAAMPDNPAPGVAVVVVQHLAADHKSMLSELVKRYTSMQVLEIEDGMVVQPDCAYIIPPNHTLVLASGALRLEPATSGHSPRMPIDSFFSSLASELGARAICIVLSGTGSDGTLGLRAVKAAGGLALVQDPDSAAYDGMPNSAIATGLADYVLPPAAMPGQLLSSIAATLGDGARPAAAVTPSVQETLRRICLVLRAQTGRDFSQYKANTLIRRVERRMALHQIVQADDYLRYLQRQPTEVERLFHDLLIGVTSFFRDPEAFAIVQERVIPTLIAGLGADIPVRVWVCGCSTGEEAYSLAILFYEQSEKLKRPLKVQIFATDLDAHAIEHARAGTYSASITADVTPERLARWFTYDADRGTYHIQKSIRDLVIFSVQDVISDPPFSRLDLISCRNLLIYLSADLQKRLIPLFHYALSPGGCLFLGTSETVGEFGTLFEPLDRTWKIYQRHEVAPGAARPALGSLSTGLPSRTLERPRLPSGPTGERRDLRALTEQTLLAHLSPVAILVTERGEILHIVGRSGNYLEPAQGDAGMNILAMAREGLRRELTIALHKAAAQGETISYRGLRVKTNGSFTMVDLTVRPAASTERLDERGLYLVILEEAAQPPNEAQAPAAPPGPEAQTPLIDQRIFALEQELRAKEEYLQTALEEMETANEELQATNEELQSVNEELQATNEELETSKEELQSVNEELATVNTELQHKVTDLLQANNDMNNLLAGTGVGTLFVDFQLRIARFTPAITQVINLIPGDVGRPVGDIVSNLVGYDHLVADVQAVLDTLAPNEAEVQARSGAWYLMRIRPYRTLDNVIEGVVITFVDITQRKQVEAALHESEARFARAFRASPDGLAISRRADGALLDVNPSWEALTGYKRQEALGRSLLELGLFAAADDWRAALAALSDDGGLRSLTFELRDRAGNQRWALVSIDPLEGAAEPDLLTIFHDVTEHRRAEATLLRLRTAEQRFATIFAASPAPLSLTTAVDGRLSAVNDAFLALFGYARAEVLGRTAAELGIAPAGAGHAAALDEVRAQGVLRVEAQPARTAAGAALVLAAATVELDLEGAPHLLTIYLDRTAPPPGGPQ